jgi:hypothetical protein
MSLSTKLVRHKDPEVDVRNLYHTGKFESYQSIQGIDVFKNAVQLLSFIATEGTHCVFVGKYNIKAVEGPVEFPPREYGVQTGFKYDLVRDENFDHLRDRLVINWGNGTRSWVQNFKSRTKSVVEILPEGHVKDFPGYLDLIISFSELKNIIDFPVANRLWKRMLLSTSGIYLILDTSTGCQYIGSAHGRNGIYGRWSDYAKDGHGGNEELRKLIQIDQEVKFRFKFSILQILSPNLTMQEVSTYENLHKEKLGTRAHGLNLN